MKKDDVRIISHLRQDGRKRLTEISKDTGIPVSTIFEKIRRKTGNYVSRHTCLIDFPRLGMNARAQIALKTVPTQRQELRDYLQKKISVNSLYKINNGYDYLIDVIFSKLKELEEFLEELEEYFKIRTKHVFYVIEEITREEFLSDPMKLDLIQIEN